MCDWPQTLPCASFAHVAPTQRGHHTPNPALSLVASCGCTALPVEPGEFSPAISLGGLSGEFPVFAATEPNQGKSPCACVTVFSQGVLGRALLQWDPGPKPNVLVTWLNVPNSFHRNCAIANILCVF